MIYTKEELMSMPLSIVRGIDIKNAEDEALIQEVVTARVQASPVSQPVYRGDVPDIKSKEQEMEWQAKIDEREAKARGIVEVPVIEDVPTQVIPEVELPEEVPVEPVVKKKK